MVVWEGSSTLQLLEKLPHPASMGREHSDGWDSELIRGDAFLDCRPRPRGQTSLRQVPASKMESSPSPSDSLQRMI